MAILHREPNQVKWIGVRPGHNGEQVIEGDTAVNVLKTIYTVPADKILLLNNYVATIYCAAGGNGSVMIYNAVPALYRTLVLMPATANDNGFVSVSFPMPIELSEGFSIRALTTAANIDLWVTINGILIDA